MRFVVYGAGAIGGVIGARLFQNGFPVVLIARGDQYETVRRDGLRLESPEDAATLRIPVVGHPGEAGIDPADVVLLAMKTQDVQDALRDLAAAAPPGVRVACALNGVESERLALRIFPDVYGISVMCPAGYLAPGMVQAYAAPVTGILDLGRYPHAATGDDGTDIAAALRAATFHSEVVPDIRARKYGKLLNNLGNAIEAVCGPEARTGPIAELARAEATACYAAAGIAYVTADDPRTELIRPRPIGGRKRPAGSTWQSLRRGAGSVETDYLNGEIVLLGRLHRVPTPVNERLQTLANLLARQGRMPGPMSEEEFLAGLDRQGAASEPSR
jgi:2-dehydropantoate 2-reductase